MIELYIVRHGETVHNLEHRIQGHSDSPLTPLGVQQADAMADRLASEHFDAIYSSDLGRAVSTAEPIAAHHNLSVMTTDLLREAYLGKVQGLTTAEFEERYPEEFAKWKQHSSRHRPPDAESIESLIERCREFVEQVQQKHTDGEKLLAVVHAGSLRGLVCAVCGLSTEFYRCIHTANACLSILELGQRPSIRLLNDTCHLANIRVTEDDADSAFTPDKL